MTEVPDFQIAMLAVTVSVLQERWPDLGLEEAAGLAAEIDSRHKEVLEQYGPELTLTAAEILWDRDAE